MIPNIYFENLRRLGKEHTEQYKAHESLKDSIVENKGWDSPEMDAWYAEKKRLEEANPLLGGIGKAYRAWCYSQGKEVVMEDFCWDRDRHDFIDTLRKAGIRSFVTVNQSTGLMEDIHGYISEGCKMEGPCTIIKKDNRFGEETEETVLGLRFSL